MRAERDLAKRNTGSPPESQASDRSGPPPASTAEFVGLAALLISLVALSIDSMLPALSVIGDELGAGGENRAQFVLSALFLGLGLGQMIYGPLSDRFGRKPAIQAGLALFALGCVLSIFATSFSMMLAGRMLQGLGVAGPRIAMVAMVRDRYAGAAMAEIMSLIMTLFVLVPAVAPAIGQALLLLGSWRVIFVMLLMVALICSVWLAMRQPETLKPEYRRPLSLGVITSATLETCRNRIAAGYALAAGLLFGAFLGYLNTAAQMFQGQYGLGALFPLYFAALALAFGSASLLNSRLVMRLGMKPLTRAAIVGVAGFSTLFFLIAAAAQGHPALWALMLYLLAAFFCVGLLFGNLNALAMEPLGHIAGIAASVIGTVTTLLSMVLGALIGLAYDGTVLPLVGGFAALGSLSFAAMLWAESKTRAPLT
ncbi:MAG: multidrug effflux MFS transporter [Geminicoccaceae bacterium]